ncbi:hypothetical protein PCE1_002099 [Barthelona sp. PCE]
MKHSFGIGEFDAIHLHHYYVKFMRFDEKEGNWTETQINGPIYVYTHRDKLYFRVLSQDVDEIVTVNIGNIESCIQTSDSFIEIFESNLGKIGDTIWIVKGAFVKPLDATYDDKKPFFFTNLGMREFIIHGRKNPSERDPQPVVFKMNIFAENEVVAKSRFWRYVTKLRKVKKTAGHLLSVEEIHEKNNCQVKNFAIFIRYNSRTGTHNMRREFRAISRCDAIDQLYKEMNGRHRVRSNDVHVINVERIGTADIKRTHMKFFAKTGVKFPQLTFKTRSMDKHFTKTFRPARPNIFS